MNIAIAAKNYTAAQLCDKGIDEECRIANRVFDQGNAGLPRSSKGTPQTLNFLFICATNYDSRVQKRFGAKKRFTFSRDGLDEVIVLDLGSATNRAEFFGPESSKVIELIKSKKTARE